MNLFNVVQEGSILQLFYTYNMLFQFYGNRFFQNDNFGNFKLKTIIHELSKLITIGAVS